MAKIRPTENISLGYRLYIYSPVLFLSGEISPFFDNEIGKINFAKFWFSSINSTNFATLKLKNLQIFDMKKKHTDITAGCETLLAHAGNGRRRSAVLSPRDLAGREKRRVRAICEQQQDLVEIGEGIGSSSSSRRRSTARCRWQHLLCTFWICGEMCSSIACTVTMSGKASASLVIFPCSFAAFYYLFVLLFSGDWRRREACIEF
jgi:hypothetical protein